MSVESNCNERASAEVTEKKGIKKSGNGAATADTADKCQMIVVVVWYMRAMAKAD